MVKHITVLSHKIVCVWGGESTGNRLLCTKFRNTGFIPYKFVNFLRVITQSTAQPRNDAGIQHFAKIHESRWKAQWEYSNEFH